MRSDGQGRFFFKRGLRGSEYDSGGRKEKVWTHRAKRTLACRFSTKTEWTGIYLACYLARLLACPSLLLFLGGGGVGEVGGEVGLFNQKRQDRTTASVRRSISCWLLRFRFRGPKIPLQNPHLMCMYMCEDAASIHLMLGRVTQERSSWSCPRPVFDDFAPV